MTARPLHLLGLVLLAGVPLAPAASRAPKMDMVHTQDVDIGYKMFGKRGSATPLIVVNGGPGMPHQYLVQNDVWARIARSRLVILYDQRGTGSSKRLRPGAPLTLNAQIADLEALRIKLGLDKVALLGDSFGGFVSMAYAAAYPDHVAKLVLSGSPPPVMKDLVRLLPQTYPDVEEAGAKETKALGETTDAATRAGIRNLLKMLFYSPAKRDAYLARIGDLGYEAKVGEAVEKSIADVDMTDKIKRFTGFPTLVMSGRYDMNVAPLNAWRLSRLIPNAQLVFFEQSSHLPFFEEPARYREVLETFLDGR